MTDPPIGFLAELTHRCPLGCGYCSNPLDLVKRHHELDTAGWTRIMLEAAALGVLQVHLSGGEPAARPDLEEIVAAASAAGLYTNLITSGVLLDRPRIAALVASGLDHVQLSFQHVEASEADRLAAFGGAHARKLAAAARVCEAGLALTVNFVVHRQNLAALEPMIALALNLGAGRIEVAHAQYHGWALLNRASLIPSRADVDRATQIVADARIRLAGSMLIDYVVPDYYARRPKACMGGWGRRFFTVTPDGLVLPCHAAETIPGLVFLRATEHALEKIWNESEPFRRFRGVDWMPEPCRSCDFREVDWGGCRCQALALTGRADRADPVCERSPDRQLVDAALTAPASKFLSRRRHSAQIFPPRLLAGQSPHEIDEMN